MRTNVRSIVIWNAMIPPFDGGYVLYICMWLTRLATNVAQLENESVTTKRLQWSVTINRRRQILCERGRHHTLADTGRQAVWRRRVWAEAARCVWKEQPHRKDRAVHDFWTITEAYGITWSSVCACELMRDFQIVSDDSWSWWVFQVLITSFEGIWY